MTRILATVTLVFGLSVLGLAANEVGEQTITPIVPPAEQRVEPIAPAGQQRVEAIDAQGIQELSHGAKGPVQRSAEAVGKVVVGVLAATVAIGITVATLFLI